MATFAEIATAALVNLLTTFLFLLAFSILRLQPQNARVYYPKWYIKGVRKSSGQKGGAKRLQLSHYVNLDYKAYLKLLTWMWDAIRMPEEELIGHAGLDSAVFLRLFLLGLKIFSPMAGIGFLILLPVNATDRNLSTKLKSNVNFSDVDKLSISNVSDKSPRLWTHLIIAYIFTIWTCKVLYQEYKIVADMRLRFLAAKKRSPDQFTVLVRQVPPDPKRSVHTCVVDFFQAYTPTYLVNQIACTQVVYDANGLGRTLNKISRFENWLNYYQNKYKRHPERRPVMKKGFLSLWGEEVDAINFYQAELEKMRAEARKEQDEVLSDPNKVAPAAFVSFKSRWAAAVCAQTQQTRNPNKWITAWAPEVRDVYWPSLTIPYKSLPMRHMLMAVALLVLMFFYMIPVLAVQSLANLDGIVKNFPFLKPLVDMPVIKSFLQGFMAGLALSIFLLILPMILMFMTKFEGHISMSILDRRAAQKLYYFFVVNVFFGSVITGSLVQQLWAILNSSSLTSVLKNFGYLIPMKATFFITFIMVDGWAGVSMEIVRLYALCIYHLKNIFLVKTEKDRDEAMAPGNILLNENVPRLELYFLLGIVYSVTTPIILPFIMVFFGFGYLAYRNQVINVYDADYDSGAAFWPQVHSRIITAMIIEQLTLIGLFTIKGPIGFQSSSNAPLTAGTFIKGMLSSTFFLVMLPIGTMIYHFYCKRRFHAAFNFYPMAEANEKDRNEEKDEPELELQKYLDKSYLHPVLKEEQEIQGKFRTVKTLRIRHNEVEDNDDEDEDDYDDDHSDREGGGGGAATSDQSLVRDSSDVRLEVMEAVPPYTPKPDINKSSELLLDPSYGQKSDGAPPSKHSHKKSHSGGGSSFKHHRQRSSEGSSTKHQRERSDGFGSPPRLPTHREIGSQKYQQVEDSSEEFPSPRNHHNRERSEEFPPQSTHQRERSEEAPTPRNHQRERNEDAPPPRNHQRERSSHQAGSNDRHGGRGPPKARHDHRGDPPFSSSAPRPQSVRHHHQLLGL
ncbi:hypothetical protein R1flu_025156 [Riccia fluitans]|uniref:Uncharacterized protein n=1 Tax=Riccia fluitans TaxID=41844 RepID=A0ABD1XX00_9MARC